MIDVKENMKQQLQKDNIKKNLRIHFPNGEREDIINSSILHESLSFTESICSQDALKFGLCEASVLEFETAEIGNIKGMEIEATLEVSAEGIEPVTEIIPVADGRLIMQFCYMESIKIAHPIGNGVAALCVNAETSEQYNAMAYPSDNHETTIYTTAPAGTKVRLQATFYNAEGITELPVTYTGRDIETAKDVAFPFVSIPLGRFVVDECKRSSNVFEIRQNTAYGQTFEHLNALSSIETAKRGVTCSKATPYRFDAWKFFYSSIRGDYEIPGATKTAVELLESSVGYENLFSVTDDTLSLDSEAKEKELYYVDYRNECTLEELRADIEKRCSISSEKERIMETFDYFAEDIFYPTVQYHGYGNYGFTGIIDKEKYIYPYSSSGLDYEDYSRIIRIPKMLTLHYPDLDYSEDIYIRQNVSLHQVSVLEEEIMLEIQRKKVNGYYQVPASNAYMPIDIAQGLLELKGMFGRYGRNGTMEFVSLQGKFGLLPSETLCPSETLYPYEANGGVYSGAKYISCWFDDDTILPYEKIVAGFLDETGEAAYAEYEIPQASSGVGNVYDLSDNVILQNGRFTEEKVLKYMEEMAVNIKDITYVPAEIDMLGLPYLESGDVIQIDSKNAKFQTIILRRTMTGIVSLFDSIESKG